MPKRQYTRCPKHCGAKWPKGDRMAELSHSRKCPKSFLKGGPFLGGKQRAWPMPFK